MSPVPRSTQQTDTRLDCPARPSPKDRLPGTGAANPKPKRLLSTQHASGPSGIRSRPRLPLQTETLHATGCLASVNGSTTGADVSSKPTVTRRASAETLVPHMPPLPVNQINPLRPPDRWAVTAAQRWMAPIACDRCDRWVAPIALVGGFRKVGWLFLDPRVRGYRWRFDRVSGWRASRDRHRCGCASRLGLGCGRRMSTAN
jgi:hypothetical protein